MKDAAITTLKILIYSAMCLGFGYGVIKFGDFMDRPDPVLQSRYKEEQASKTGWCREQQGRPQFNKFNEYIGCK